LGANDEAKGSRKIIKELSFGCWGFQICLCVVRVGGGGGKVVRRWGVDRVQSRRPKREARRKKIGRAWRPPTWGTREWMFVSLGGDKEEGDHDLRIRG